MSEKPINETLSGEEDYSEEDFYPAPPVDAEKRYTEEEFMALQEHVMKYFGPTMLSYSRRDPSGNGVSISINVIPPRRTHPYVTLVTLGLSALRMQLPKELRGRGLERCELVLNLPANWNLDKAKERGSLEAWPFDLLLMLASLPYEMPDVWLLPGYCPSMADGELFTFTKQQSALIYLPVEYGRESIECTLPGGECVNFYKVISLYPEEKAYCDALGLKALIRRFPTDSLLEVIQPQRMNVITDAKDVSLPRDAMFDSPDHWQEIIEKEHLKLEPLAAYGLQARYLRWCIARWLVDASFEKEHQAIVDAVRSGQNIPDLRVFLRDQHEEGMDFDYYDLNKAGAAFTESYYRNPKKEPVNYFSDMQAIAETVFGFKNAHRACYGSAACLALTYDEVIWKKVEELLDSRFEAWRDQEQKN